MVVDKKVGYIWPKCINMYGVRLKDMEEFQEAQSWSLVHLRVKDNFVM
jgi:hypothetical protein